MKLLLDTHAFIWWDSAPDNLSRHALSLCQDTANELFLSTASLWEIEIKSGLGKLTLNGTLPDIVDSQREANGVTLISVEARHVFELKELPSLHKDPFDRMLVAQARIEGMCLVTHDSSIREYPVDVEW